MYVTLTLLLLALLGVFGWLLRDRRVDAGLAQIDAYHGALPKRAMTVLALEATAAQHRARPRRPRQDPAMRRRSLTAYLEALEAANGQPMRRAGFDTPMRVGPNPFVTR